MKNQFLMVVLIVIRASVVYGQWNPDLTTNNLVCNDMSSKFDLRTISDNEGGLFIVWAEDRDTEMENDIYFQHVDANGNYLYAESGRVLVSYAYNQVQPAMIPDGEGGFIAIWEDHREEEFELFTPLLFAQRIDENGNEMWSASGVKLHQMETDLDADGFDYDLISDGNGGAIISWTSEEGEHDVHVQHINWEGETLWGENGFLICGDDEFQKYSQIEPDGADGAFIIWNDFRYESDGLYMIGMQHIDTDGNTSFTTDGIFVKSTDATNDDPRMIADGAGGVYMVWGDNAPGYSLLRAQRIALDGALLWDPEGVLVADHTDQQGDVQLAIDHEGNLIVAWINLEGMLWEGYAQKINTDGEILWDEPGVDVFNDITDTETEVFMMHDGVGGAVVGVRQSGADDVVKVRHINSDGSFDGPQTRIADSEFSKFEPLGVKGLDGNFIITWTEDRDDDNMEEIFASSVQYETESLAIDQMLFAFKISPNPTNGLLHIRSEFPIENWTISNLQGSVVKRSCENTGTAFHLDCTSLSKGLYLLTVQAGGMLQTIRIELI